MRWGRPCMVYMYEVLLKLGSKLSIEERVS
jgi:hypothetical protein